MANQHVQPKISTILDEKLLEEFQTFLLAHPEMTISTAARYLLSKALLKGPEVEQSIFERAWREGFIAGKLEFWNRAKTAYGSLTPPPKDPEF